MSISEEELELEKKYLSKVKAILEKLISQNQGSIDYNIKSINELKRFMWDNLSDYTDEERAIALYEVDRSVDSTNDRIQTLNRYMRALDNPYFAKIVFKYDENDEEKEIYIGMTSVQDKYYFYVFDWRSPISSLFYNYELGDAKYESPGGDITGEILSKMQFKIESGEIVRCFRSDINIDDEFLQEILSNSSTDKMKNIVSTIQREQNQIIRNDRDKYLIVQGVAGSGKTSVALHRIAYLLYKDHKLKSNNVLIFSPNNVFSDYISNVLPELGEENVMKSTIIDFILAYLKPYKKIEDYTTFLERVYSVPTNRELIEYKMSNQCMIDIDEFIANYERNINFGAGFVLRGVKFPNADLQKMFIERYGKYPFSERIDAMCEHICGIVGVSVKKNASSIKKYLLESSKIILDPFELYNEFLRSKGIDALEKRKTRQDTSINYEDTTGLLYMYCKINDFPNYNHIRQVVIDEVQDYTYFQLSLLRRIFKNAAFTLLGDVNQTINPCYHYESLEELTSLFPNSRYIELNKTYRSSEEIIEYSNQILGLENVCSIRKTTNVPVEIKDVPKKEAPLMIIEDLQAMAEAGINKVAVITRDAEHAKTLHASLSEEVSDIQLISSTTISVKDPVVVIPSYLSKGLEFDAVIVYNDPENNYTSDEKNLYYVVCTRAQHKLHIYNEPEKVFKKK